MRVQDQESGKSRLNLHCNILEGKSIGWNPKGKKYLKRRSHNFKNQDMQASVQSTANSRIQSGSNESKLVPRNLDPGPHLKWALVVEGGEGEWAPMIIP